MDNNFNVQQNSMEQPMYQQMPQQPMDYPMYQQMPQQPMEQPMYQQMPQQPMEQPMYQQMPQQPMDYPMYQQMPQQPMGYPMYQQMPQQPAYNKPKSKKKKIAIIVGIIVAISALSILFYAYLSKESIYGTCVSSDGVEITLEKGCTGTITNKFVKDQSIKWQKKGKTFTISVVSDDGTVIERERLEIIEFSFSKLILEDSEGYRITFNKE